jgi:hypothetical protein
LPAAADGVEAASSSGGMPSPATALFIRAMGRKRPRVVPARGAALSPPRVAFSAWPRSFLSLIY